jgi:hypothetical protein
MPLFLFFIFITYTHSITLFQYIYPSPFTEVSLHLPIACKLSGKNLPAVPSRESNSGLPYSKPTTEESMLAFYLLQLRRRQEVKQSLLRQRENLETVRERMEAELR